METVFSKLVDQFIGGKMSRRDLIQSLAAASIVGGAPAAASGAAPARREIKAVAINHVSYQVKDYAKARDFYAQHYGMNVSHDNGRQAFMTFGDTFLILRQSPDRQTPLVDHIAYTVDGYGKDLPNFKADNESMGAELKSRGLNPEVDTELSWTVKDPEGFTTQVAPALMMPGNPAFERVMSAQGRPANAKPAAK